MLFSGFDVEQNTLGGDIGGEASDSDDSSYKDYESDTSYSDSFEFDGDRVDEPKVELIGEMIQKELDHLSGSNFWGLGDDFDSNSDEDLNNNVGYDEDGNKKYPLFNSQIDLRNPILTKGLVFPSRDILKYTVKQYRKINKGYYGGHLLAAVGVDANDCVYPVAFAVVESENKHSWFWFLELLQRDLDINNSYNICFMSDKQKIILKAKDKPILTMLEIIRRKFMTWLVSIREAGEKYPGPMSKDTEEVV
ncbi:hypothetical protein PVK06_020276 [Gossypium arboreum]|uniref:MULE transposase domain-containing protein n=1 Tax=Gossypium arboreum TaxID=29729 RepID=A0ABR0PLY3_GOSAR|nr:hypothetical protein PVK06_020276 [Gossypium arboreum]